MTRKIEAAGTAVERVTEYTYDMAGNPLTVKTVGDAKTQDAITTMTYDNSGNLLSQTDPEGNTTQLTYDIMGNVVTRTDARNKVWSYGYDDKGRLTSTIDPLNNTSSYEYDHMGNRIKETDAEGKIKTYEYDDENRLVKAADALGNYAQFVFNTDGKLIKQVDQEGKEINYQYDLDGRQTKVIDGNGNETTTEYNDVAASSCSSCSWSNGIGQPSKTIYPTYSTEYQYDTRGRKAEAKDVLSSTEAYATQFSYDSVGNLITQTDKESRTTTYQYDELGRKVKTTDALAGVTEYTYDNRSNLISLKDAKGNTTTFEYDGNNRLTKETRPLGQTATYQYNATGSLIRKTDAKNQKIEYEYDDAGKMTRTKYFAVSTDTTPVKTVDFTYDKTGNLKTYDDGTTSAAYVYDDAYRKLSETVDYGSFSLSYAYTYYKNGLKKSLTMPDGTTYEYTYDNNNQISVISIPGQGFLTYNQYTWTMPSGMTLPGGVKRQNTYTPLMQLKSMAVKDSSQNSVMSYDYSYSPAGNVTAKNTDQWNYVYQYDPLYRMVGASYPSDTESFTYDSVGNRLTSADVAGNWAYDQNNELLGYDAVSYDYDGNGNTTSKTDPSGMTIFSYDFDNRLVQIRNPQLGICNYYYDPFGKRLWKEISGTRTHFLYSEEGLIGEYNALGTEIRAYGYSPNSTWTTAPLFQEIGTNYYWYQNDHLGTPQKVLDARGTVVWSAMYDSFGGAIVAVAGIENNLRFPGQYYDQETGLHYNWNRHYDPKTGRYLTPDPIRMEDGVNLFAYGLNNPLSNADSNGLFHYKPGVPPAGAAVEAMLRCMDRCLDTNLGISGGSERDPHDPEYHPWGHAADISYRMNRGLQNKSADVMCCAKKCGAQYGRIESNHYHVQTHKWRGRTSGDLPECGCDMPPDWH
jgi:large repetitive protein